MNITFEELQGYKNKLKESIDPKLELHVHDDIDYSFNNELLT